jgi:hypothetical protein
MVNVQNCDSYINISSLQTYKWFYLIRCWIQGCGRIGARSLDHFKPRGSCGHKFRLLKFLDLLF